MLLKPCPRCGHNEVITILETSYFPMDSEDFNGESIYSAVQCQSCKFTGRFKESPGEAKEQWNTANGAQVLVTKQNDKIFVISKG